MTIPSNLSFVFDDMCEGCKLFEPYMKDYITENFTCDRTRNYILACEHQNICKRLEKKFSQENPAV